MSTPPALVRRLGLADAVFIGLGSMIGAGVFSAFAPAAAVAGTGLLIGLVIAAVVAFCNATSSAQLAAAYPTSGGTYAYGRAELGPWWGFIAGWCFVIGKLASCAAMALTFAAYAAPPGWERPVAILAVAALVTVNYFGVTRTAQLTRVIVVVVLLTLAVVVAAGAAAGPLPDVVERLEPRPRAGCTASCNPAVCCSSPSRDTRASPRWAKRSRTRAARSPVPSCSRCRWRSPCTRSSAITVLAVLGPEATAASTAPLADAAAASGWGWTQPVVRVGAAAASLGALLALIAGIGRTTLAMAREDDLPRFLSAVHPRWRVPHRAELAIGAIVIVAVAFVDLRGAIGFSSFGVLIYYFIANAAAWRQSPDARRYPRALQVLGLLGCTVLVVTLPLAGRARGHRRGARRCGVPPRETSNRALTVVMTAG